MPAGMRKYLVTCGVVLAVFLLLAALFTSAVTSGNDAASNAGAGVQVSSDAAAAKSEAPFGLSDFSRANKGTAKLYSGRYYGYRYPLASKDACAVAVTGDEALVFVPREVAERLGIDLKDPQTCKQLTQLVEAIDRAAANGGPAIADARVKFTFVTDDSAQRHGITFQRGVEVEEDYYYLSLFPASTNIPARAVPEEAENAKTAATYAESFKLLPANEVTLSQGPTGMAALASFLTTLDWRPLWVSLRTTALAMVAIFFLGLLAAWGTVRVSARWKGLLDTIFTIPMVLPPTVCGFLLLLTFGQSTAVGRWLIAHGIDVVFTWPAVVIACIVVAFPLMYRTARGAFEGLDADMLDAARTLGWSERRIFTRLMIPLTWPSIAAGTVLAFARSMGEFGATLFFAGNYAGVTQTIPIAIYFDWMAGDTDAAIFWVVVVILLSFAVILLVNNYSARMQKWKRPGALGKGMGGADRDDVDTAADTEGSGAPRA
jgi:molybdate transport system permease protein